jgi:hypothetical protein
MPNDKRRFEQAPFLFDRRVQFGRQPLWLFVLTGFLEQRTGTHPTSSVGRWKAL